MSREFHINVEGGTDAGRKRPPPGPAEEWFCLCPSPFAEGAKLNPRYLVACPDCKAERPS